MSKVINPPSSPLRLSYPSLFEPKIDKKGNKKYSAVLIGDKADSKLMKTYEDAIEKAIEEGVEKCKGWRGKRPAVIKTPLKDGDTPKANGDPRGAEFVNSFFMNVSTNEKTPPGIVDRDLSPLVRTTDSGERVAINGAESKIYPGAYVSASINFAAYEFEGSFGISAYINNIMFVREGERLAGAASAQSDFADFGPDAL